MLLRAYRLPLIILLHPRMYALIQEFEHGPVSPPPAIEELASIFMHVLVNHYAD